MNERIRDLQIQAFAECKTFEDDKIRTDEVFERFAELIVKDCITKIALIGVSNFENDDIMWTVELATKMIKERFGVKE